MCQISLNQACLHSSFVSAFKVSNQIHIRTEKSSTWWKWSRMMKMEQNDENGAEWWKWPKMMKMAKNDENGQNDENGPEWWKWPRMMKMGPKTIFYTSIKEMYVHEIHLENGQKSSKNGLQSQKLSKMLRPVLIPENPGQDKNLKDLWSKLPFGPNYRAFLV